MKKILFLISFLCSIGIAQAQFIKLAGAEADKKMIELRGPVSPVDLSYADYKSYALKTSFSSGLEASFKAKNLAYSAGFINEHISVFGLKKKDAGDFTITYDLKRFELVLNESYLEATYQNAPAYYIGLESELTIQDKQGKVIYKRYNTPKVKMFVTDFKYPYDLLAYRVVLGDFSQLFNEFESYYLNSPNINLEYFEVKKRKKSKSTFNVEEFNQSTQVLSMLLDVDRNNWSALFGEAQKYWKPLLEFTDDDEDLQQDIRFNAHYNSALTSLLLGKFDDLDKYLPGVKQYDKSFLGMRANFSALEKTKQEIKDAQNAVKEVSKIEPVASEPFVYEYKKTPNAFKYAELEKAEVTDDDNKKIVGTVRVLSDFPQIVDLRTEKTRSGLGQLTDQLGSDKSSVWIYIDGEKKPKRTNLKKLFSIKDKDGKVYLVGKTGQSSNILTSTNLVNNKHYALFDEVKSNKKLSLFQEFFPQDSYAFKRPQDESFFVAPEFMGRRKALKEFFVDCPSIVTKIDQGIYDFNNKETYLKLYNDYTEACGK